MAIEKKLIHFSRLSDFETQLNAGNILDYSIVFIQDAKKIWTHSQYYDCNGGNSVDLSEYLTADEIAEIYATTESLNGKQDTLISGNNIKTINGESIIGSGNIVISGGSSSGSGAYPEIDGSIYKDEDAAGEVYIPGDLLPNTFYVFPECTQLAIHGFIETSGVANEYIFQFTSGAKATTLSLLDDIRWTGGEAPTIEAGKIYQVSILKGLGSVLEWDNVVVINFFINGIEYQAEEGMTWREWVNTNYNTLGYYYDSYSNTLKIGSAHIVNISVDDLIINDASYTLYDPT